VVVVPVPSVVDPVALSVSVPVPVEEELVPEVDESVPEDEPSVPDAVAESVVAELPGGAKSVFGRS
jgi:hypothetical protein